MKDRFEVNNGVIFDNNTGLMWMQEPLEGEFAFDEACELKREFAGYSDWRLPNIKELISIVNYETVNPCCYEKFLFCGKENKYFWSSTAYACNTVVAWCVDFYDGYVSDYGRNYKFPVRLVRNIL